MANDEQLRDMHDAVDGKVFATLGDFAREGALNSGIAMHENNPVDSEYRWWLARNSAPLAGIISVSLVRGASGGPELQLTLSPEAAAVPPTIEPLGVRLTRVTQLRTTNTESSESWMPPAEG
jgi:hypothetical protein